MINNQNTSVRNARWKRNSWLRESETKRWHLRTRTETWKLTDLLRVPEELGWRKSVVDLRPCSPNILKTSGPLVKKGLGATDERSSPARNPGHRITIIPEGSAVVTEHSGEKRGCGCRAPRGGSRAEVAAVTGQDPQTSQTNKWRREPVGTEIPAEPPPNAGLQTPNWPAGQPGLSAAGGNQPLLPFEDLRPLTLTRCGLVPPPGILPTAPGAGTGRVERRRFRRLSPDLTRTPVRPRGPSSLRSAAPPTCSAAPLIGQFCLLIPERRCGL